MCLCVLRAACHGQEWTEKWIRTRELLQLGEDVRQHAGDPASPGAFTPRSRPR